MFLTATVITLTVIISINIILLLGLISEHRRRIEVAKKLNSIKDKLVAEIQHIEKSSAKMVNAFKSIEKDVQEIIVERDKLIIDSTSLSKENTYWKNKAQRLQKQLNYQKRKCKNNNIK